MLKKGTIAQLMCRKDSGISFSTDSVQIVPLSEKPWESIESFGDSELGGPSCRLASAFLWNKRQERSCTAFSTISEWRCAWKSTSTMHLQNWSTFSPNFKFLVKTTWTGLKLSKLRSLRIKWQSNLKYQKIRRLENNNHELEPLATTFETLYLQGISDIAKTNLVLTFWAIGERLMNPT